MITVNRFSDEHFDKNLSTSGYNPNKNFIWVNDGSGDISVFIDRHIPMLMDHVTDKPKYGWLLESRTIIPEVFEWVEQHSEVLSNFCDGIFTCDERLAQKKPFLYTLSNAVPWIKERAIYPKTKLVSMISSSKAWAEGHRNRLTMVEKYKNDVDLYGRGINHVDDKIDALKDYMFSIQIENYKFDDYFTEKLTDCFATGTIPIFYGTKNVLKYFDGDGIIFLDDDFKISDLSEDLYYSKMQAIKNNFELVNKLPTSEDYIYDTYFKNLGTANVNRL